MNGPRLQHRERTVAGLVSELRRVEAVSLAGADPSIAREGDRHGLVGDGTHEHGRRGGFDLRAPRVAVLRGIRLDLAHDEVGQALLSPSTRFNPFALGR
jgi:hypothetical protein